MRILGKMDVNLPEALKRIRPGPWFEKAEASMALMGENAVELAVTLVIMIMVERQLGKTGLGTFSFLLSLYFFSGIVSDWGIARAVENEAAHRGPGSGDGELLPKAVCASLVMSVLFGLLLTLTAALDTSFTRVNEKMAAYILLGAILPVRNLNRIRMAHLQGIGHFSRVARLKILKKAALIVSVHILLGFGCMPSYLLAAYLMSEIILKAAIRKKYRLPGFRTVWASRREVLPVLADSRKFMFTDELLDTIFFIDFFLLGLFVPSATLGIYAEASILVRLFLLLPVSLKPLFRKTYCGSGRSSGTEARRQYLNRSSALMFYLHAVLALYCLLFYTRILTFLSPVTRIETASLDIFAMILPGLLLFCTLVSQEPVYEAMDAVEQLQREVIRVVLLNAFLNILFIPFAGITGAAAATALTMGGYFLRFGRGMPGNLSMDLASYLSGGAVVYLVYHGLNLLEAGGLVTFFLVPLVSYLGLKGIDFFDGKPTKVSCP